MKLLPKAKAGSLYLPAITTSIVAALIYGIYSSQWFDERQTFIGLTLLLLAYLWLEVRQLKRLQALGWLINPVVLASIMTFALLYGLSNFLFFVSAENLALVGLVPEVTPAMVKLLALVIAGAIGLWSGYWVAAVSRWSGTVRIKAFQNRFLPQTRQYKSFVLPALVLVATVTRIVQVQLGVYGYSSTYERLVEMGSVTQYLAYGSALGKLALLLVCFQFFSTADPKSKVTVWFYGIFLLEVFWGLLSGFKSSVLLPIVVVAVIQYLVQGRLVLRWLLYFVIGLVVAYGVIEPFRVAKNNDPSFDTTSLVSIASALTSRETVAVAEDAAPFVVAFLSRQNLTYIGSLGIDYGAMYPQGRAGDPDILSEVLLAPLYAWIPRVLWEGKPLGNIGLWYTQSVMEKDHFSSTAMGMVTYLYFAGGLWAIFSAYFFTGFVLNLLWAWLQPCSFLPGAVVFIAGVLPIAINNDTFSGTLIALSRELPLLMLLQFAIFKGRARRS